MKGRGGDHAWRGAGASRWGAQHSVRTARKVRRIVETDQRFGEAGAESCLGCELHDSLRVSPEGNERLSLELVGNFIQNIVKRSCLVVGSPCLSGGMPRSTMD